MVKAVFIDRDGVVNDYRLHYVKSWEEFAFLPGVFEALADLAKPGRDNLAIVIVSNQAAIGRRIISAETVDDIHRRMIAEIEQHGGRIDLVLYCPHRPDEGCACRKPASGMLRRAAEVLGVDLQQSYLVGDAISDIEAGQNVGCRGTLVLTGRGRGQYFSQEARRRNGFTVARNLQAAADMILADLGLGTATVIDRVSSRLLGVGKRFLRILP